MQDSPPGGLDTRSSRPGLADDEISLRAIAGTLARHLRLIGILTAVCTVLGIVYAGLTQPLYTATVTARPISEESRSTLSGLEGQASGFAAAVGLNVGSGQTDVQEYMEVLKSRALTQEFIEEHALKPQLFAGRWDGENETWKDRDPGLLGRLRDGVSRFLAELSDDRGWHPPTGGEPSDWRAYKKFSGYREVERDPDTGMVTVAFEHPEPETASEWANAYLAMANAQIREETVREASRALDYLNEKVEETSIAGLRDTIYALVEKQMERIMLANARPQYAFKVLDPAVVPQDQSYPDRKLMAILSIFLGLMLGVLAAMLLELRPGAASSRESE